MFGKAGEKEAVDRVQFAPIVSGPPLFPRAIILGWFVHCWHVRRRQTLRADGFKLGFRNKSCEYLSKVKE